MLYYHLVSIFPQYRKRFIAYIPNLLYLDDRPVFDNERRISEAWIKEGQDGEWKERQY
jgi:dynein assembly factor 1